MDTGRLVLASASPRRREILDREGYSFDIDVAGVEELQCLGESALHATIRLALEKADVDVLAVTDAEGAFIGMISADDILKLDEILDETGG